MGQGGSVAAQAKVGQDLCSAHQNRCPGLLTSPPVPALHMTVTARKISFSLLPFKPMMQWLTSSSASTWELKVNSFSWKSDWLHYFYECSVLTAEINTQNVCALSLSFKQLDPWFGFKKSGHWALTDGILLRLYIRYTFKTWQFVSFYRSSCAGPAKKNQTEKRPAAWESEQ